MNKLLIVVDCLRYDQARGVCGKHFSNVFAVESTTPICFASMVTGLAPHEHGLTRLTGQRMRPVPTHAIRLKENGYCTAAFLTGPLTEDQGIFHDWDHVLRHPEYIGDQAEEIVRMLCKLPEPWFALLHAWELHEPLPMRWESGRWYSREDYDAAYLRFLRRLIRIMRPLRSQRSVDFWITADHGQALYEDNLGVWGHGHTCDDVVSHIPLVQLDKAGLDSQLYSQQDTIPLMVGWPVPERTSVTTWAFRATPITRYNDGRRTEMLQEAVERDDADPIVIDRLKALGYIP